GAGRPGSFYQNSVLDLAVVRSGKVADGYLVFSSPAPQRLAGGAAVQALG
ncbi:hypothetical protein V9P85_31695, partial [Pseudomonas aeruginosa]